MCAWGVQLPAIDNFANFSRVTVSSCSGGSSGCDATATTIVLMSGHGSKVAPTPTRCTWYNAQDYPDPANDPLVEIIRVTARSTDTLTIDRAVEGPPFGTAHNISGKTYKLDCTVTAAQLNDISNQLLRSPTVVSAEVGNVADDTVVVTFSDSVKASDYDAGVDIEVDGSPAMFTCTRQMTTSVIHCVLTADVEIDNVVTWSYTAINGSYSDAVGLGVRDVVLQAVTNHVMATGCSPSMSSTVIPDDTSTITDSNCDVWTLVSSIDINKNGVHVDYGELITYYNGTIYTYGGGYWYIWNGSFFAFLGPDDPEAGSTPTGYFVSLSGSNSNTCMQAQSTSTPKLTLTGASGALACMSAGDTVYMRLGTYTSQTFNNNIPSGSSWVSPITIAAYPGEVVWLTPSSGAEVLYLDDSTHHVVFDGINMSGINLTQQTVVLIGSTHHIRIKNAEIIGSPLAGSCANICGGQNNEYIHLVVHGGGPGGGCGTGCSNAGIYTGGTDNLIEYCEIYDTSLEAIQIYGPTGTATGNVIRNNKLHDIIRSGDNNPGARVWGIMLGNGDGTQVYNNIIYGVGIASGASHNAAISIYAAVNSKIFNNTIYANINDGLNIDVAVAGTVFQNNIVYLSGGTNYQPGTASVTHDHNLEGTNPLFTDASTHDFTLQSGSPAKDTGVDLSSVMNSGSFPLATPVDFFGTTRSGTWDIGAVNK